jgi:uncharacterized membrane protein YraQ (UPF0718 family)/YHS domain-containing protein
MIIVQQIFHALDISFNMFWEVLWPLALGFLISAIVQTFVSKGTVARALGKDSIKSLALASGLGAASSSCSYAAVSVGRTLFRKGATFTNAIVFEFASTNLVFELGLVLLVLLGWQFLAAEFAGGILMIAILVVIFKYTLRATLLKEARAQADRGLIGKMEGHGDMDMSVTEGPLLSRIFSGRGVTAVSHYFYMDAYSLWQDLALGFLISGALAAWVPIGFWQAFFLTNNPQLSQIWGPLVGPIISMLSFVCSIGNVPLAAVLWNGGISFGGVISFIFADLIILPIINIYRKYYGRKMSVYLLITSYAAMALAGFLIGLAFQLLGLTPAHNLVAVFQSAPSWNYTTFLNLLFLGLMGLMFLRFLKTGGPAMLSAMEISEGNNLVVDPVCKMKIKPEAAPEQISYRGNTYYFCCSSCRKVFEKAPAKFI